MTHFLCDTDRLCKRVAPQGAIPPRAEMVAKARKMALPAVAESLLIALVGIVDTFMVSGLGDYAISAVGLTNQPKFLGLAVFMALSQAVSLLVARRKGEGRQAEANRILQQSLLVIILLGVVLTVFCVAFADPAMRLMGSQPDTHSTAVDYFRILMAFMLLNAVTLTINGAQRGVGNTKIALKTNIVSNAVNVVLNYLLIEGRFGFPRLEVRGAAIATVIGTAAATVMALLSVSHSAGYLNIFRGFKLRLQKQVLALLFQLGTPTLIEQLITRVGFIMYFSLVARLGTTENAAHHIGMNFLSISYAFADGLSATAIALVGFNLGANRKDLAYIYSSVCQRMGLLCSALVAVVYAPFGRHLYALFSQNPVVQGYGATIMPLIAVASFIQIALVIFLSSLRAAGDVRYVAVMSIILIGFFRPAISWVLIYPAGIGLIGAWLGMIADQTARLVVVYLRYRKGNWMNIKI